MMTTYNPSNPDIKKFIGKNWNIIEHSNDCANTFPSTPIVGFRKLPNLREILTKASISYPPQPKARAKLTPSVCTRLGKCTYCPLIHKINIVKCKITNKITPITKIPKFTICEHRLSVSQPRENRITPVSKHFTEKGHSVKDMQFSVLEWCSLKYHKPDSNHRKMREKWWMWNIGAIHPIGINQFI